MFVHLTLVPYLGHAGELKTKPTQHSVQELRRIGIQPDILLVCRSEGALSRDIREKIALFANLPVDAGHLGARRRLDLQGAALLPRRGRRRPDPRPLRHRGAGARRPVATGRRSSSAATPPSDAVRIGLVGKYIQLEDAYLSVIEALGHAGHPQRREASRSAGSTPRRSTARRPSASSRSATAS